MFHVDFICSFTLQNNIFCSFLTWLVVFSLHNELNLHYGWEGGGLVRRLLVYQCLIFHLLLWRSFHSLRFYKGCLLSKITWMILCLVYRVVVSKLLFSTELLSYTPNGVSRTVKFFGLSIIRFVKKLYILSLPFNFFIVKVVFASHILQSSVISDYLNFLSQISHSTLRMVKNTNNSSFP